MSAAGQSSRAMASAPTESSLLVLFGRAFLVQLRGGDLETAKVFARAFLLWTPSVSDGPSVTLPGAG